LTDIGKVIENVEARWQSPLLKNCRKLFSGVFMPSHDHSHHHRVWNYAKSILLFWHRYSGSTDRQFVEELIIAAYFHDTGMVIDPGINHGKASKKICLEFFKSPGFCPVSPAPDSLKRISDAIESHDDKSLKTGADGLTREEVPDLGVLLAAADDLDAYGKIGIYRYAEIYLLRGLQPEDLPGKVSGNVWDRFESMRASLGFLNDLIDRHEPRFREVYDFYLRLGQAMASVSERSALESELIRMIGDALRQKTNLLHRDRILPESSFDKEIREWFRRLDLEIQARII
jgi:HD superfamily phosphodiesterase